MASQPVPRLLGRDVQLDGAVRSIRERGIRHLGITGRTGVGKTALAIAVARRLHPDPVIVPVDGDLDAHEVFVRLGRAIGVTEARHGIRRAVTDTLADGLSALVLDGCDDWPTIEPLVDGLLDACPDLAVLVTARTPPPDASAPVIHLPPLQVPGPDEPPSPALRQNPAVQLFVDRAQAARPSFEPTIDDLGAIAEVCRRLDGLPLAISLAAARISLMEPAAMLREMGRVGPWRLVGLSLRQEFARSVERLDERGRRVLLALDVFVGGASVDALHAVAGLDEVARTVETLAELVDLDLVTVDRARARYSVTSATTTYLRGSLDASRSRDELRARHARHFVESARDRVFQVGDDDLAIDHANRLAATRWLRGAGEHDSALRLLVDIAADFDRRGEPETGRHLLTAALGRPDLGDPRTRARGHLWVARFIAENPEPVDRAQGVEHLRAAWDLAKSSEHEPTIFVALFTICETHTLLGSFDLAAEALDAGLARAGGGRHPIAEVGLLTWKAVMTHQQGDETGAAETVADAIAKAVALEDRRLIVRACLVFLGLPAHIRARIITDSPSLHRLLELAREDGDHRSEGWLLALAGGNALDESDPVRAAAAGRELLALSLTRANAPLGRLGLALVVRLAATMPAAELAARLAGALDRHGPVIEASMAPHTYASYCRAVRDVERTLGATLHARLRARGALEDWHDLTVEADHFLGAVLDGSVARLEAREAVADVLSPRELEVLAGLVAGQSNKDIAADLGLRPKTVMHHCAAIYRKLDVAGRAGAVAVALQSGFVPPAHRSTS